MSGYQSPFTGAQVDATVSAYISGGITSAINTASGGAVTEAVDSATVYTNLVSGAAVAAANVYTDARTSLTVVTNTTDTAVTLPVLSGGTMYKYTQPVSEVSAGSVITNFVGDVVHFTAISGGVTVDLPANLTVLQWDNTSSGYSYDLMFYYDRVILKEVVSTTL